MPSSKQTVMLIVFHSQRDMLTHLCKLTCKIVTGEATKSGNEERCSSNLQSDQFAGYSAVCQRRPYILWFTLTNISKNVYRLMFLFQQKCISRQRSFPLQRVKRVNF